MSKASHARRPSELASAERRLTNQSCPACLPAYLLGSLTAPSSWTRHTKLVLEAAYAHREARGLSTPINVVQVSTP